MKVTDYLNSPRAAGSFIPPYTPLSGGSRNLFSNICKVCNKLYSVHISKKLRTKYCSKQCQGSFRGSQSKGIKRVTPIVNPFPISTKGLHYELRNKAKNLVAVAIKNKELIKLYNCSKCNSTKRIEAHHKDYSKPLEIIWLCRKCHWKEHYVRK